MLGGAESLGSFAEYFTRWTKEPDLQKKKSASRLATYFSGVEYGIRRVERQ